MLISRHPNLRILACIAKIAFELILCRIENLVIIIERGQVVGGVPVGLKHDIHQFPTICAIIVCHVHCNPLRVARMAIWG